MSIPVLAFFNNRGGAGTASLVYHLAWMYADLGIRPVAVDLDPQANLSAAFLSEHRLATLWVDENHARTIYGCINSLCDGTGDRATPHIELIDEGSYLLSMLDEPLFLSLGSRIALVVGDLALSQCEDQFSDAWSGCLDGDPGAFRVLSAFWTIVQQAADLHRADLILVDSGPNLGALNRAALITANYVALPLSPDIFSLQGQRTLGPTLNRWREGWSERLDIWQALPRRAAETLELPAGAMEPAGYILLQHALRLDHPINAYDQWMTRIPSEYRQFVLHEMPNHDMLPATSDQYCLALLKHYRTLLPLAQEAHKPMFHLKPADGALGSIMQAAQSAYQDFRQLAVAIARRINISLPQT